MVSNHFIGRKAKLRHEADIKYIFVHVSPCRLPEAKCEDSQLETLALRLTKEEELIIKKSDKVWRLVGV